jgi:hypothetical protein
VLEIIEQERGELLFGFLRWAVEAVRVAHVVHLRHQRLERRSKSRDAVDRQGPHRRPVIGDVPRDGLPAPAARKGRARFIDARRRVSTHRSERRSSSVLTSRRVVLARKLPGGLDSL